VGELKGAWQPQADTILQVTTPCVIRNLTSGGNCCRPGPGSTDPKVGEIWHQVDFSI
jgi:hypothetical protein